MVETTMISETNGTNGATNGFRLNGTKHDDQLIREPLKYSGSLDKFESVDLTTIIGREFPKVQLTDLLKAHNADVLLRDLAITGTGSISLLDASRANL